jgi:hypothetical protein
MTAVSSLPKMVADRKRAVLEAVRGVQLAADLGAKCVSLTGMVCPCVGIVCLLTYFLTCVCLVDPICHGLWCRPEGVVPVPLLVALKKPTFAFLQLAWGKPSPTITTGHHVVVSAVVFSVCPKIFALYSLAVACCLFFPEALLLLLTTCQALRMLVLSQRQFTAERLALVGLGSIGRGVLHIVTAELPAPSSLLLIDVESKKVSAESLREFFDCVLQAFLLLSKRISFAGHSRTAQAGRDYSLAPPRRPGAHVARLVFSLTSLRFALLSVGRPACLQPSTVASTTLPFVVARIFSVVIS